MRPILLLVSDDAAWCERLAAAARVQGRSCLRLRDPLELPACGPHDGPGLAVVDWTGGRGRRWAESIRKRAPGCAVAFAAAAGELAAALGGGADGLIAKDCTAARLAAQLRALGRRAAAAAHGRALESARGDLRFDPARGRVEISRRGAWRPGPALSPKEAVLLRLFLEHPGRTVDRGALLEAAWGARCGHVNPEALDKQVAALRRKLGAPGRALQTVHGRGYRWD